MQLTAQIHRDVFNYASLQRDTSLSAAELVHVNVGVPPSPVRGVQSHALEVFLLADL